MKKRKRSKIRRWCWTLSLYVVLLICSFRLPSGKLKSSSLLSDSNLNWAVHLQSRLNTVHLWGNACTRREPKSHLTLVWLEKTAHSFFSALNTLHCIKPIRQRQANCFMQSLQNVSHLYKNLLAAQLILEPFSRNSETQQSSSSVLSSD